MSVSVLSAQTADKRMSVDVYGDWAVRCSDADLKKCIMTQKVSPKGQQSTILELNIARSARPDIAFFAVMAVPEGAEMSVAPQIQSEAFKEPIILKWRVCLKGTCRATVDLTTDILANLAKNARAAAAYVRYGQQKAAVAPISLKGFSDAITALQAK